MLEYRRLVVLLAVARAGSMAGAATDLGFTPSAVSQQVAALERQARTPLVIRQPRGVRLTEAGELLAGHASVMAERLQRAQGELDALIGVRAGRLRMASFASAGSRLLPDAVKAFGSDHPEVDMSLEVVRELAQLPALVRDGVLDLGFAFAFEPSFGTPALDVEGLQVEHLVDDDMLLALPPEHRLVDSDRVDIEIADLAVERWVRDSGPLCHTALLRMCAAAGFEPQVAFDTDDYLAVGRLVASGLGVALVPTLAAADLAPEVVLRRTRPRLTRRIVALLPDPAAPAARAMLDAVTASLSVDEGSPPARPARR